MEREYLNGYIDVKDLEEGMQVFIDFSKINQIGLDGHQVIPVVLQDTDTLEILFIGYTDHHALQKTLEERSVFLYSTSRHELWHKGATSGNILVLIEVRVNCEQNSLLYLVRQNDSAACHTINEDGQNRRSCYYRRHTLDDKLEPIT